MSALQAITMPDCRYEEYRYTVDFIQKYIFPGGFLPSTSAISDALASQTDFRVLDVADFSWHYAETLSCWRSTFWEHIDQVRELGFDDKFVRTWDYYLAYCEAGFREHQVGVKQFLFGRPGHSHGFPMPAPEGTVRNPR